MSLDYEYLFAFKCYVNFVWPMGQPWPFSVNKSYYYEKKNANFVFLPGAAVPAGLNGLMHQCCSSGKQGYGCSTRCAIWFPKYGLYAINLTHWDSWGSWSTSIQVLTCDGTKPLTEQMLTHHNYIQNKFQWNLSRTIFIQGNAFENVICKNGYFAN